MADANRVGRWLETNGVSSVRVQATNHDGLILGKHLAPAKFVSVLDKGTPIADTAFGVDFSGDVAVGWDWGGWRGEVSDIVLMPDRATLVVDPELPGLASAICDFTDPQGNPLPGCYRGLLKRLLARLADHGYTALVAPELEFMVFEEPIQQARAQGYRDLTPLGGETRVTYSMTRSRDASLFMDAVIGRLEALGIEWESWSSETAPGQFEINLAPADPLTTADSFTRTKLALREIAAVQDRSVTFMAYGVDEYLGGGTHLNLSLVGREGNSFHDPDAAGNRSGLMGQWLAGLLATMPAAMSFFTPTVNSYRRLVELTGPPMTVSWGEDNKSAALRTIARDPASSRIEHRVPSSDSNIYLALAAIIGGGLIGMEDELSPPPELREMAWLLPPDAAPRLPDSLTKAAAALAADGRLARVLGQDVVDYWLGSRRWEWIAFHTKGGDPDVVGEYELKRYFEQT
jgi:glutamine synthetase